MTAADRTLLLAQTRPPRPEHQRPSSVPRITAFVVGGKRGGELFAGAVPFRYSADGARARAYKAADCETFAKLRPGAGFSSIPLSLEPLPNAPGLTVDLAPGRRDVCLQLSASANGASGRSNVARATVTVIPRPEPANVRALTLRPGGASSGSAAVVETGQPLVPVVSYSGTAHQYRLDSCTTLASARWQPLPVNRRGSSTLASITREAGGLYTFCVQLRAVDTARTEVLSNTRNTQARFLELTVQDADPLSVFSYAAANGYSHVAQSLTVNTTCRVDAGGFTVGSAVGSRCQFRIFEGRPLNPGWQVEDIGPLVDPEQFELQMSRRPAGSDPSAIFTIRRLLPPTEGSGGEVRIRPQPGIRVRLRGPENEHWQMAFGR